MACMGLPLFKGLPPAPHARLALPVPACPCHVQDVSSFVGLVHSWEQQVGRAPRRGMCVHALAGALAVCVRVHVCMLVRACVCVCVCALASVLCIHLQPCACASGCFRGLCPSRRLTTLTTYQKMF